MNRNVIRYCFASLAVLFFGMSATSCYADEKQDADALTNAEAQIVKVLDELKSFYKVESLPNGRKRFIVLYENGGREAKIGIFVRKVGTSNGIPVVGYYAFTQIAAVPEGQSFPPAVIKFVVGENDNYNLCFLSMAREQGIIFINATGIVDELSKKSLDMTLLYMTHLKADALKSIESLVKDAN